MRILLVEDDRFTAAALKKLLLKQQYQVDVATTGEAGWEQLTQDAYDLLLLDWMLPELDGIQFCRQLRSTSDSPYARIPILLMTAFDSQTHRVTGLDAGADDYLVKPFDAEEFLARIRALLRRSSTVLSAVVEWGDLQLDPRDCQVTYRQQPLPLTAMEYRILELLLRNPKQVFSQTLLIDRLWTFEKTPTENTVRAHIRGLRKKLRQVGAEQAVETVHGFGYRLGTVEPQSEPQNKPPGWESATWQQHQQSYLDRVTVLDEAIVALQRQTCTENLMQRAKQQAHTLIGSLGSYGLTTASLLCREIEQALDLEMDFIPVAYLATQITQLRLLINQGAEYVTQQITPQMMNLLTIDDDADFAEALLNAAESFLVQAEAIVDLTTAQRTIKQLCDGAIAPPDILLFNLHIFGSATAGLESLAALTTALPHLRVLVFTTQPDLTTRVKLTEVGGWQFLAKPIAPVEALRVAVQLWQQSMTFKNRLMIVDDDHQMLASLQQALQPEGFELVLLQNAEQFWEVLQQSSPDLLILDLEMPHFNGIELCRVLRNDVQHRALPIMFLSAHADAEHIRQAFAAGADDYLTKPISPIELQTRLLNRLRR
jgi:DNA-binding response OmpR family regulator